MGSLVGSLVGSSVGSIVHGGSEMVGAYVCGVGVRVGRRVLFGYGGKMILNGLNVGKISGAFVGL